jgi:hypothetical protein
MSIVLGDKQQIESENLIYHPSISALEQFTVDNISERLNKIDVTIALSHTTPFPRPHILSQYTFQRRPVTILPDGSIQGGYCNLIYSLIDFSFIRSIVAHCYSTKGPPCYDPVSLFLLDLFHHIDEYQHMSKFLEDLHNGDRGKSYRDFAGISPDRIPCAGTFSHFRTRLGDVLYNHIFHVLVDIFVQLKMISFTILSHDGTLYPSWSRYKGCTYFCDQCPCIKITDIRSKIKNRILYRLNNLSSNKWDSECRVTTECPSKRFPPDVKKPNIELFAFKLAFSDGQETPEQKNTAAFFNVKTELEKHNLSIITLRSHIITIDPSDGSITISCPKLPKDIRARIGVRCDPQNPNKIQKIFGYDAVFSTSIELTLGLELPVAASNIPGNAEEGSILVNNREQIRKYHTCNVKIDLADSKYDIIDNYDYIRKDGSIPIVDYNRRNERIKKDDLIKRGYDEKGWPFAPCGLLCRPNGFDNQRQCLTFCCFKQCLTLRPKAIEDIQQRYDLASCPHRSNQTGFVKHMYIKDHPRLVNEIPRGSQRYKNIKKLRTASERLNSSLKNDLKILEKPRILDNIRADILTQIAVIVLLLKRAFSFIVRTTILMWRLAESDDPASLKNLNLPHVPKAIAKVIQLE